MLTFYLVRHGQTDANVKGIRPGDLPFTLTELGREQATKVAEALKAVKFNIVYASDYLRTVETAGFIMRHQTYNLKFDVRLRDLQQGEFLGLTAAEIAQRFPGLRIGTEWSDYNTRRPGGESFADCEVRAWDFMLEKALIWSETRETDGGDAAAWCADCAAASGRLDRADANICVVTHGSIVNVIAKQVTSVWVPKIAGNCSITVVRYSGGSDGQWTLDRMEFPPALPGTLVAETHSGGVFCMAKTVLGVFDNVDQANRAADELERKGFDKKQISVIAKESSAKGGQDRGDRDSDRGGAMTQDVSQGVTTGGAIGAGAGLLAGIGALAIPGIGPILAAGPIAATLTGAVTGGLAGGLVDWGVPEDTGRKYEEKVKAGKIVCALKSDDAKVNEAADILRRSGASDVETH